MRGWYAQQGGPDGKAHGGAELYSAGLSKAGSVLLAPNVMFRTKDATGVFTEIGVLAVFSAEEPSGSKRLLITLITLIIIIIILITIIITLIIITLPLGCLHSALCVWSAHKSGPRRK